MSQSLKDWLSVPGNTAAKLCRLSGLDAPVVSRLRRGRRVTLRLALILDKATNGEIPAESVVTDAAEVPLIKHLRGEQENAEQAKQA